MKNLFFILSILFFSCSTPPERSEAFVIEYETTPDADFFEIFDFTNASLLCLGAGDDIYLGYNLEMAFGEDVIVALDKAQDQVFLFDMQGNFLRLIGMSGNGPGEYNRPRFIQIDQEERAIDVLCNDGRTVMTYGLDGRFIRSFEPPVNARSFARVNSNLYYFYSGHDNPNSDFRLHSSDTDMVLDSYLPLTSKAFELEEQSFYAVGNEGFFREAFIPEVYLYDSEGIHAFLRVDFGEAGITKDMLANVQDPFVFFSRIMDKGFATIVSAFKGKDLAVLTTNHQSNRGRDLTYIVVNTSENKTVKSVFSNLYDVFVEEDIFRAELVHVDSNDQAFFLIDSGFLEKLMDASIIQLPVNSCFEYNENPFLVVVPVRGI
jgi:hypothetical protein